MSSNVGYLRYVYWRMYGTGIRNAVRVYMTRIRSAVFLRLHSIEDINVIKRRSLIY